MSFVDEINVYIKAGDGGDGVVRWRRETHQPKGGPSGGDGGEGGDVYVKAVQDVNLLAQYAHKDSFIAEDGEDGRKSSQEGKNGEDLVIELPVGSVIKDNTNQRVYELTEEGEVKQILSGGEGGRGNESYKSSTNQRPEEFTEGEDGEAGDFHIELQMIVSAGLIGLPSAGKSSLLNEITNAKSKVGAYEFTTLNPHLGDLYGFVIADIPGLIEGASGGKGLGHKFLRHIKRTQLLVHCVSAENEDVAEAYETIRHELEEYDEALLDRPEIIVLTKTDVLNGEGEVEKKVAALADASVQSPDDIMTTSILDDEAMKGFKDYLVKKLRDRE